MFNMFKKAAIANRVEETILYECVMDELEQGMKIKGLWGKALANSEGSTAKAESLYLQYRVQDIKDIFTSMKIAYDEMSKSEVLTQLNDIKNQVSEEEKEQMLKETLKKNDLLLASMFHQDKCVANYKNKPGSIYFEWKNNQWIKTGSLGTSS